MVKVNPVTEEKWSRFCKTDAKDRLSMQETPVRNGGEVRRGWRAARVQ